MSSAAPQQQQEEQAELMLRLQSQFGDIDLSKLLTEPSNTTCDAANDDSSEESSLAEPSPEELKAWQASQFQQGQVQKEAKRTAKLGAVQRRREELKKKQTDPNHENGLEDEDEDWEQVAALPDLKGQSSVFFPTSDAQGTEIVGVHPLLQQLAIEGDPDILGTAWKRLYSSADGDGLSFFNLLSKIQGYPGPTVLLIGTVPSDNKSLTMNTGSKNPKEFRTGTVGFYTTSPWTEATSFTGSSDCFLFSFDDKEDTVKFFRPQPTKDGMDNNDSSSNNRKYYMYCHPSTMGLRRSTATAGKGVTDGLVHGIGVGGSPSQPRLHLSESLEDCRALDYCSLFEAGDLLLGRAQDSLNYFDVDSMEVWAVGGEEWIQESLREQQAQQEMVQANRVKARTVDKQQFLRDFQGGILSGDHIPSGLFAHHGYNTDRCGL